MQSKINRAERLLARLKAQLQVKFKAGLRDERGAAAVFFAVGLVLLAPAALGLVDVYLTTTQRAELQDALDTATLYAARSDKMTNDDLKGVGEPALLANLKLPPDTPIESSFTLVENRVTGTAKVPAAGIGPQLWPRTVQASSEVLRNSNNVEVALVLDTTGSMRPYMGDLRAAAKDLVNLVVKDVQKPYYTKVALVPYSVGVNMGSYDLTARGGYRGTSVITAATQAKPVVVTSADHGLADGERVNISGVSGMTAINGTFAVYGVTKDTFKIKSISDSGAETDVDGRNYTKYNKGGVAECRSMGCRYNRFTASDSKKTQQTYEATKCASERLGTHAYSDVGPATAKVGWNYSGCSSEPIVPLSSSKSTLTSAIDKLSDSGSTAGQIGLAWGWYMVSPAWSAVWPTGSVPAAYDAPQTIKAVILMTDGAFNSPYCKGVIASDAGPSSGAADTHINCKATNGDPFAQAAQMCTNMKKQNVVVYTVGFGTEANSDSNIRALMSNCATSPEYVYMPKTGAELKVAFRTIAQDINSLRISK